MLALSIPYYPPYRKLLCTQASSREAHMLRCLGLVALSLASVAAHGAGVWRDPNHALGDGSLAGLRFIAESPPHVLTHVENKALWPASAAQAADWPRLAEARGSPEARSVPERGLRRASWPRSEPPCFPHRFWAASLTCKEGDWLRDPVKTQWGWHIIMVQARITKKNEHKGKKK